MTRYYSSTLSLGGLAQGCERNRTELRLTRPWEMFLSKAAGGCQVPQRPRPTARAEGLVGAHMCAVVWAS